MRPPRNELGGVSVRLQLPSAQRFLRTGAILVACFVLWEVVTAAFFSLQEFTVFGPEKPRMKDSDGLCADSDALPIPQERSVNTFLASRNRSSLHGPPPPFIPRVIVQVFQSSSACRTDVEAALTIRETNPDFSYEVFTMIEARAFMEDSICGIDALKAFDALSHNAYRIELFVLCYLYARGGVFVSPGVTAVLPLSSLVGSTSTLLLTLLTEFDQSINTTVAARVSKSVIGCAPESPFLKQALHRAISARILSQPHGDYGPDPSSIAGSGVLSDALAEMIGYDVRTPVKKTGAQPWWKTKEPERVRRSISSVAFEVENRTKGAIVMVETGATTEPLCTLRSIAAYTSAPDGDNRERNSTRLFWSSCRSPYSQSAMSIWHGRRLFGEKRDAFSSKGCRFWRGVGEDNSAIPSTEGVTVPAVRHAPATVSPAKRMQIPNLILQSNRHDYLPAGLAWAAQAIRNTNPDYEYVYYSDRHARDFIFRNFNEQVVAAYDALVPGAFRADLFRYCFLYLHGGVYVDMDIVAAVPFSQFIHPDDTFVVPEDNKLGFLYNAFIAVVPAHPIIRVAIESAVEKINRRSYGDDVLDITGPKHFSRAFKSQVKREARGGTSYGNGIRLLAFRRFLDCAIGAVLAGYLQQTVLWTPYTTYRAEMRWYTGDQRGYAEAWRKVEVYSPKNRPKPETFEKIRAAQRASLGVIIVPTNEPNRLRSAWAVNNSLTVSHVK